MKKPGEETKKRFSQEQYDILMNCSERKDAREWNTWRYKNFESALLLEGADFKNAYLSGLDLSSANLKNANLSEAYLWITNLNNADLRGANLSAAEINEADLTTINASETNCTNTKFNKSNLWVANLSKANLSGASFREVNLWEANLFGANLYEADLWYSELYGADLRETMLDNANLGGARLVSAKLNKASLTGIKTHAWNITDWNIHGVHCNYIYTDVDGVTKYPHERDFEPGEFEKNFTQYPSLSINFQNAIEAIDIVILVGIIEKINKENKKQRNIYLVSVKNSGLYPSITFAVKQWDEKESARDLLLKKIKEVKNNQELINVLIREKSSVKTSLFFNHEYTLSAEENSGIKVETLS